MEAKKSNFPKYILDLTTDEKRSFLNSFDSVFSDIDGVLWNCHQIIPGAAEGFNSFRNIGKNVRLLTNNSYRPAHSYESILKKFGFDYDAKDIIHPAKNVIDYLKSINFDGLLYVIASSYFKELLSKEGFNFIDVSNNLPLNSSEDFYNAALAKDPVRAVIIDNDLDINYVKILRANTYLKNPECLLIVGATDISCPLDSAITVMGPGVFSKMIAEICQREPITLGKPGKELAKQLINLFKIDDPKRTLMIGDMLEQDIGFGKICGFQTLAVLSGGCTLDDLKAETNEQFIPDYYAISMGDFEEFMKDLHTSNV